MWTDEERLNRMKELAGEIKRIHKINDTLDYVIKNYAVYGRKITEQTEEQLEKALNCCRRKKENK